MLLLLTYFKKIVIFYSLLRVIYNTSPKLNWNKHAFTPVGPSNDIICGICSHINFTDACNLQDETTSINISHKILTLVMDP